MRLRTLTDAQIDTLRTLADQQEHALCGRPRADGCVSTLVVEHLRALGLARWALHGAAITSAGRAVIERIDRQHVA